mmetsp:Transcript_39408/g.102083  ORF Transcript_39408/g.102083 Transcript_39408/m.102083 type:complete len:528 (-) Transcript_39408:337-1920(-)
MVQREVACRRLGESLLAASVAVLLLGTPVAGTLTRLAGSSRREPVDRERLGLTLRASWAGGPRGVSAAARRDGTPATTGASGDSPRGGGTFPSGRSRVPWVPGKLRPLESVSVGSVDGRPLLTPFGRSVQTVVVVGLASGVCQSRRDDWRSTLPRALASYLSHAQFVVYSPSPDAGSKQCFHCRPNGRGERFDCDQWHSRRGRRPADLMIIVGTGRVIGGRGSSRPTNSTRAYPTVNDALHQRWVGRHTVTMMLPIRKLSGLMTNPHRFDMMIPDGSFFKPLTPNVATKLARCARPEVPKKRELMYVGRYAGWKGQLNFLQRVDPTLLRGYTIKFYGQGSRGYAQRLKTTAARRNISAEVSPRGIPHARLMLHTCASAGQVHLAYSDNNPRAAYEGLYAGNPLLVSERSNLPDVLRQQPFVTTVDPHDPAALNAGMARFLDMVQRDMRQEIVEWLTTYATPSTVFFEFCARIGICAYEGTPGAAPLRDDSPPRLIADGAVQAGANGGEGADGALFQAGPAASRIGRT